MENQQKNKLGVVKVKALIYQRISFAFYLRQE
jgi:hypothetical protein